LKTKTKDRQGGISAVAGIFCLAAVACAVTAALTAFGRWPLAWGRYIVGDLVTMGPVVFVVAAVLYAAIASGLLVLWNWARRMAIVVAAVGLFFLIAPISSAVEDLRLGAIAINGSQIIFRVLILWYLMQQEVADAFA
jgi:hypothetical protein